MPNSYYTPRYQQRGGGGGNGLIQLLQLFAKGQGVQEAGTIPGQEYTVDGQTFQTADLPLMRPKQSNWLGRVFGNAEQGEQQAQAMNLSARMMQAGQQNDYQKMLADITAGRTNAEAERTFRTGERLAGENFLKNQAIAGQAAAETKAQADFVRGLREKNAQSLLNKGTFFSPDQLDATIQQWRGSLNDPALRETLANTAAATQKADTAAATDFTLQGIADATRQNDIANALAKSRLTGTQLGADERLQPLAEKAREAQLGFQTMLPAPLGTSFYGRHPNGTLYEQIQGMSTAIPKPEIVTGPNGEMTIQQGQRPERRVGGQLTVSQILGPQSVPAPTAAPQVTPQPAPQSAPEVTRPKVQAAPVEQPKQTPLRESLYKQLAELAAKNSRFGGAQLKSGLTQPSSTLFRPASVSMEQMLADLGEMEQGKRQVMGYPVKLPSQDVEAMRNIIAALLRKDIPANPAYE